MTGNVDHDDTETELEEHLERKQTRERVIEPLRLRREEVRDEQDADGSGRKLPEPRQQCKRDRAVEAPALHKPGEPFRAIDSLQRSRCRRNCQWTNGSGTLIATSSP